MGGRRPCRRLNAAPQDDIQMELGWRDKLIVFSSH